MGYGRHRGGTEIEWLAAFNEDVKEALVREVERLVGDAVLVHVDADSPPFEVLD